MITNGQSYSLALMANLRSSPYGQLLNSKSKESSLEFRELSLEN